jgi:ribonuclease P protein component
MKPFSLSKHERLKSKKDIDTLFLTGKAFFVFPFKVFYTLSDVANTESPLNFGISVPKKLFKRSVDRNVIKRRTREIYRVNKPALKETILQNQQQLKFMLVYADKKILSSEEILPAVVQVLKKLIKLSGQVKMMEEKV